MWAGGRKKQRQDRGARARCSRPSDGSPGGRDAGKSRCRGRDARRNVPVEHADDVVEAVVAPHRLVAGGGGEADRAIVAAMARCPRTSRRSCAGRGSGERARGRGRSGRTISERRRCRPAGVAPSPSRFRCVTPLRPSAQCSASEPQRRSPRCGSRGDEKTVISRKSLAKRGLLFPPTRSHDVFRSAGVPEVWHPAMH